MMIELEGLRNTLLFVSKERAKLYLHCSTAEVVELLTPSENVS